MYCITRGGHSRLQNGLSKVQYGIHNVSVRPLAYLEYVSLVSPMRTSNQGQFNATMSSHN